MPLHKNPLSQPAGPTAGDMLDLQKDWSISFAGCGFMGIYYVGVSSCILERAPHFIQGAFKIYGASAGALMAAILTAGVPLGEQTTKHVCPLTQFSSCIDITGIL